MLVATADPEAVRPAGAEKPEQKSKPDVPPFEVTPTELEEPVETLTFSAEGASGGTDLVFRFENRAFTIALDRS